MPTPRNARAQHMSDAGAPLATRCERGRFKATLSFQWCHNVAADAFSVQTSEAERWALKRRLVDADRRGGRVFGPPIFYI